MIDFWITHFFYKKHFYYKQHFYKQCQTEIWENSTES